MFPSFHKRNAAAVVRAAPATWTPALSVAAVHVSSLASTASRPLSAASEAHLRRQASQRHAAWTQFTSASRQLRKAVHTPATVAAGHQAATTSLPSSYMAVAGMEESNSDDALAALAPSIIRRTSTAAASAALMRELGVIDRAEYRPENVAASSSATASAALPASPLCLSAAWSPYLTQVCQAGVSAQVSSAVILKHLWSPFQMSVRAGEKAGDVKDNTTDTTTTAEETNVATAGPTLQWCASLPSSVRQQLLAYEVTRVERCRAFIRDELRGKHSVSATTSGVEAGGVATAETTHSLLSNSWRHTTLVARAVLRCCAAPWLLASNSQDSKSGLRNDQGSKLSAVPHAAVAVLLSAAERNILVTSLRLAEICHAEDVGLQLMQTFVRSVDVVVRRSACFAAFQELSRSNSDDGDELQRNVEAFESWYETEGVAAYEAAMGCIAHRRHHATPTLPFLSTGNCDSSQHGGEGFARAYSLFVHHRATRLQLSLQREGREAKEEERVASENDQADEGGVATTSTRSSSLTQHPGNTMRLLLPLAECVDANADHFEMVMQLYVGLLQDTDVAYTTEGSASTRATFAALLRSLARVSLAAESKTTLLEDLYRRTLLNSSLEVVRSPAVLSGCLLVCSATGAANRSTSLFNQLAEPSSRGVALAEENMAAVCLAQSPPLEKGGATTPAAAAVVLQRLLSFVQTRMAVTADIVHAGVAAAMLEKSFDSTAAFAMLDLLTGPLVQSRMTRSTAARNAERTFFLRLVLLLSGMKAQPAEGGVHGGATSNSVASSLHTAAAAAIFQQWVRELAEPLTSRQSETGQTDNEASVAPLLSLATVGVLQEICIVLQRADAATDTANMASSKGGQTCPLVKSVRGILAAVPNPVTRCDWCATASAESLGSSSRPSAQRLVALPSSFQWKQLSEEWPLQSRQSYIDAFTNLFTAPTSELDGVALCMRYQEYQQLDAFYRSTERAAEFADNEYVWKVRSLTKGSESAVTTSLQAYTTRCIGQRTVTRALRVMSPLAEVDWWVGNGGSTRVVAAGSWGSVEVVSLSRLIGVSVPPVLGCSAHTWAADTNQPQSESKDGGYHARVTVATYWLRRWVDSVEETTALPRYSLFREAAVAAVESVTLSSAVHSEKAECAESGHQSGEDGERKAAVVASTSTEASKLRRRRDGVEQLFVQGPETFTCGASP